MLIISRSRHETAECIETASLLATKFNVAVLSLPFLYDIPAEHPVIERLRYLPEPASFLVPLSVRSVKSLLTTLRIPFVHVFETAESVQIPDGGISGGQVERLDDTPKPRWYPIIDDSLCSACLECVNYCLFGVYTIGSGGRPLADQPDACRDGCPACARVCPSQAIMFPLYEDRVIAGYVRESADELNGLVDLVEQI